MLHLSLEGTLLEQVSLKFEAQVKNLVSVLVTSTPVIETREEAVETAKAAGKDGKESEGEYSKNLAWFLCIRYLITFRKMFVPVLALFDSSSEVNAIHLTFA